MSGFQEYIGNVRNSVTSIFEGLAVTMSWMFREPSTIQYPYHPSKPGEKIGGPESLPDRYRGFLEVDMDICTACLACERACPIDCIKIDLEKVKLSDEEGAKPIRALTRFDIDMAKCMYCGLCQEPCPTNAIRHTKHFEASVANLEHLLVRFVDPVDPLVPFKVKKGLDYGTVEYGSIAQSLYLDKQWDLPPIDFPEIPRSGKKAAKVEPRNPWSQPFSELANSAKGVAVPKLAVILEEAMAGTDCGACQYPTCKEYSVAIAKGECKEFFRCEPGGEDAQVEATQIMAIYMDLNKPAEGATETPAAPEGESAPATDV